MVNAIIAEQIQRGNMFLPNNIKGNEEVLDDGSVLIGWLVQENKKVEVFLNPNLIFDDFNVYVDNIAVIQFKYRFDELL